MNKELSQFDATLLKSLDEFMESYKMIDVDRVYSNGTEFVPIFRVKQWCEYNNINKLQVENQQLKKQKEELKDILKIKLARYRNEEDYYLTIEDFEDLLRMLGEIDVED